MFCTSSLPARRSSIARICAAPPAARWSSALRRASSSAAIDACTAASSALRRRACAASRSRMRSVRPSTSRWASRRCSARRRRWSACSRRRASISAALSASARCRSRSCASQATRCSSASSWARCSSARASAAAFSLAASRMAASRRAHSCASISIRTRRSRSRRAVSISSRWRSSCSSRSCAAASSRARRASSRSASRRSCALRWRCNAWRRASSWRSADACSASTSELRRRRMSSCRAANSRSVASIRSRSCSASCSAARICASSLSSSRRSSRCSSSIRCISDMRRCASCRRASAAMRALRSASSRRRSSSARSRSASSAAAASTRRWASAAALSSSPPSSSASIMRSVCTRAGMMERCDRRATSMRHTSTLRSRRATLGASKMSTSGTPNPLHHCVNCMMLSRASASLPLVALCVGVGGSGGPACCCAVRHRFSSSLIRAASWHSNTPSPMTGKNWWTGMSRANSAESHPASSMTYISHSMRLLSSRRCCFSASHSCSVSIHRSRAAISCSGTTAALTTPHREAPPPSVRVLGPPGSADTGRAVCVDVGVPVVRSDGRRWVALSSCDVIADADRGPHDARLSAFCIARSERPGDWSVSPYIEAVRPAGRVRHGTGLPTVPAPQEQPTLNGSEVVDGLAVRYSSLVLGTTRAATSDTRPARWATRHEPSEHAAGTSNGRGASKLMVDLCSRLSHRKNHPHTFYSTNLDGTLVNRGGTTVS
eukprot:m.1169558 g.1169558  ORF g.1169558 m.1169558 type:complete len:723 (+) comp24509_c1_seq12:2997-5165(+)